MRKTRLSFRPEARLSPRAGFTLIELLVVLGVIGILAAATANAYIKWLPRMRFQAKMEEVGTLMQRARLHSIQHNQDVTIAEDPASDIDTWQYLVATAADGREVGRVEIPKPQNPTARLYMVTDLGTVGTPSVSVPPPVTDFATLYPNGFFPGGEVVYEPRGTIQSPGAIAFYDGRSTSNVLIVALEDIAGSQPRIKKFLDTAAAPSGNEGFYAKTLGTTSKANIWVWY